MYEITADVNVEEARLCKLMTRVFDGYVRVAQDETIEHEGGNVDFISHQRRVMDVEVIRAGLAFRVKVSRAQEEAGIKTPLGTIVGGRGLEEMMRLEGVLRERAAEIQEDMRRSLIAHEADEGWAKCEVELVVLKLEAEAACAGAVERIVQEAIDEQLAAAVAQINATTTSIRELVAAGNVPRAVRQTGTIERALRGLQRRGWSAGQVGPLFNDLTAIRAALKDAGSVAEKLAALDCVPLMKGLTAKAAARPHLAAA